MASIEQQFPFMPQHDGIQMAVVAFCEGKLSHSRG
jgi:hypothetical protein